MSDDSDSQSSDGVLDLPPPDPFRLADVDPEFLNNRQHVPLQVLDSLDRNWSYVRTHYRVGNPNEDVYVIRLNRGTKREIERAVEAVLLSILSKCRISVSFSYILRHKITGEYMVYYAGKNTNIFSTMKYIWCRDHIQKMLQKLRDMDIFEFLSEKLPNSKWIIHSILSVTVHVGKFNEQLL